MSRNAFIATGAAIVVLAVLAGVSFLTAKPALRGSVIEPPMAAPAISLSDTEGEPFSLGDFRGRVVLMYFGYTNCPDECPLTTANLKLALELLGADVARTEVVLVTTDPLRDTPGVLRNYLDRFNPGFRGLTGTREQLESAWRNYGVTVEDGGETHSNYLYVIDATGNLVETLIADAAASDVAADVRVLLKAQ
jgi:protein SCO1/2